MAARFYGPQPVRGLRLTSYDQIASFFRPHLIVLLARADWAGPRWTTGVPKGAMTQSKLGTKGAGDTCHHLAKVA